MRHLRPCLVACSVLLVAALAIPALAQQKMPDGGLYTLYSTSTPPTMVHWLTCGSVRDGDGCYGSGSLGPFTDACSIVQSVPVAISTNTVIRFIYVLDSGATAGGAVLTAYKRTDVVSASLDSITVTQVAVVPLPQLTGGSGVSCMMAQNPTGVYASTNQSTVAATIDKTTYAVSTTGGSGPVTSITADSYGFVTIIEVQDGVHSNYTIGPNGQGQGGGGGDYFMTNPINGMTPANYPWP